MKIISTGIRCLGILSAFISISAFSVEALSHVKEINTPPIFTQKTNDTTTNNAQKLEGLFEFEYVTVEFNASYSDTVISSTAPVVDMTNEVKAFYLESKIKIPSSEHFDIAMTASFNQLDESQNSFQQIQLTNSISIVEKNQSAHYGLFGHYALTSAWQVTGGIIHSLPVVKSTAEANNLAIIGTTYSF